MRKKKPIYQLINQLMEILLPEYIRYIPLFQSQFIVRFFKNKKSYKVLYNQQNLMRIIKLFH